MLPVARPHRRVVPTDIDLLEPEPTSFAAVYREARRSYAAGDHVRGRLLTRHCERLIRRAQFAAFGGRP
jgi:hypothetical protein